MSTPEGPPANYPSNVTRIWRGGEAEEAISGAGQCEFLLMTSSCSCSSSCERRTTTLEEINNGPIIFVLGKKERSSVIWPK